MHKLISKFRKRFVLTNINFVCNILFRLVYLKKTNLVYYIEIK